MVGRFSTGALGFRGCHADRRGIQTPRTSELVN
jgi:hypothetical protein